MLARWLVLGFLGARLATAGCVGDCDRDGIVTTEDLDWTIEVLLGQREHWQCLAADGNLDLRVSARDLVQAVSQVVEGCPLVPSGTLVGQVVSATSGLPLEGVRVRLPEGRSCTTGPSGFFSFERLPPGELTARFAHPRLAPSALRLTAGEDRPGLRSRAMLEAPPPAVVDVDAGVDLAVEGARLAAAAGDWVDDDGEAVHGEVELRLLAPDLAGDGLLGLPLTLEDGLDLVGERRALSPLAALALSAVQGGAAVRLREGSGAVAVLAVPAALGGDLVQGQVLPVFVLDDTTGSWVETDRLATVQPADDGGEAWALLVLDVPEAPWWIVARPVTSPSCLDVLVRAGGEPLPGADVVVRLPERAWHSRATTGDDGRACVSAPRGEWVTLGVHPQAASAAAASRSIEVPAGIASCAASDCLAVEPFDLSLGACLEVRTVDHRGEPVEDLLVRAQPGGASRTDAGGRACVPVPAAAEVLVQAVGRTGRQATSAGAAACGDAACVETTLGVLEPAEGDGVGGFSAGHQLLHAPFGSREEVTMGSAFSSGDRLHESEPTWTLESEEEIDGCSVVIGRALPHVGEPLPPSPQRPRALDAGGCGQVTNGTLTVPLVPLLGDEELDPPLLCKLPGPVLPADWPTGGTLTHLRHGGADLGPVHASVEFPPRIELIAPDLSAGASSWLHPGEPLTVAWEPLSEGVLLLVLSTRLDDGQPPVDSVQTVDVSCVADDAAGSWVLTAAVTARLHAQPLNASFRLIRVRSARLVAVGRRGLELVIVDATASSVVIQVE